MVEGADAHKDQMRPRLCLTEERRPARRAESPVHLVATVRDTWIVVGLAGHRERRCTEAGVDRSAPGTDILALPAPANARDNRRRRAFPANCPTEASTCYRHSVLKGMALIVDLTSESTGLAISQAFTSVSDPTGDVPPNLAFERTRRFGLSTWRALVRRSAQLNR
jgi:hypothetical protein